MARLRIAPNNFEFQPSDLAVGLRTRCWSVAHSMAPGLPFAASSSITAAETIGDLLVAARGHRRVQVAHIEDAHAVPCLTARPRRSMGPIAVLRDVLCVSRRKKMTGPA